MQAATQPKMSAAAVKRYGNLDPADRSRIKGKAASMNIGISRSEFAIIRTCSVWVKKRKVWNSTAATVYIKGQCPRLGAAQNNRIPLSNNAKAQREVT
jgi:hypothetical protein